MTPENRQSRLGALGASSRERVQGSLAAVAGVGRALEVFDRPWWLYRARGAIPHLDVVFRDPVPPAEPDVALCRRLIDAYVLAQADAPAPTGMWSHGIFEQRQRELVRALDRGDPTVLAELLAGMFRSDFVLGMAPGSLGVGRRPAMLQRLGSLTTLSKLVSLAESQGVARVENPEQGAAGVGLENGVDALVRSLETHLEISLDFPDVGAAYGVMAAGRLITPETPDQVYAAARLREAIGKHLADRPEPLRVVEIGGGYGGMAYWLLRMVDSTVRYVVIDLPVVNVLQGYFLSQALGHTVVSLYGEETGPVSIVPGHALSSVETPFDALVNKDSMPEMAPGAASGYLSWARSACNGIFYSYNQEAAASFAGTPQIVVPEVLGQIGGFTRISRDVSWLRRGYAEEIYVIGSL
jgi:hypothetical protein